MIAVTLAPFVLIPTAIIAILAVIGEACQAVHDIRVKRREGG